MCRQTNENSGHRFRLRERFLRSGIAGLAEHELLELLLCYAIARKDVKPLAKTLLRRFGSLEAVLGASSEKLMQIDGIGINSAALLKLIMCICLELMSRPLREGVDLKNPEKLQRYLQLNCSGISGEKLYLLLLDRKNRLLDTLVFSGYSSSTAMLPEDLKFQICCCRGVRQVIMAHNHPGGSLLPSRSDISSTLAVKKMLNEIGVTLLDHFIVSPQGCVSMMKMPGMPK
ncbi:MAG: RadC family protein [Lentisphaeria bacterium]|nr:RadC family protein [Lentisphaeria bacterium]